MNKRKPRQRTPETLAALRAVADGESLYRAALEHKMAVSQLSGVWYHERARGLKETTLAPELWKALNKRYPKKGD